MLLKNRADGLRIAGSMRSASRFPDSIADQIGKILSRRGRLASKS